MRRRRPMRAAGCREARTRMFWFLMAFVMAVSACESPLWRTNCNSHVNPAQLPPLKLTFLRQLCSGPGATRRHHRAPGMLTARSIAPYPALVCCRHPRRRPRDCPWCRELSVNGLCRHAAANWDPGITWDQKTHRTKATELGRRRRKRAVMYTCGCHAG